MSKTKYQFKVEHLENGDAKIFVFVGRLHKFLDGKDRIVMVPAPVICNMFYFGIYEPAVDPLVKSPTAKEKSRGVTMEQKIAKRVQEFDRLYNKYQFQVKRRENGSAEIFPFLETDLPGVIEIPPVYMKSSFGGTWPAVDSVVEPPTALEKFFRITMEQKVAKRLKKFDKVYNRE